MRNNYSSIKVENVSKIYRLGLKDQEVDNFASALYSFIKSPISNFKKYRSLYNFDDVLNGGAEIDRVQNDSVLWALRDVSFDVKQGDIIGIIGHNGAGKSTLLKILSRITPPTKGRVTINGRVSSLLEVGTGFHPELTGRENVYLNGTILGMRKKEVDSKFDAIVDFSGVEKFLDTPVKRYSSGMRVRLAFSVAAYLDPEILIVDEVLAVGDAAFQKKCVDKMQDVGKDGRTVVFVSHSMPAITRMCSRVLLMRYGSVIMEGETHKVVSAYLKGDHGTTAERRWDDADKRPGGEVARLRGIRIRLEDGQTTDVIDIRHPVGVEIEIEVLKDGHIILPAFSLWNDDGTCIFQSMDQDPEWIGRERQKGIYKCIAWIPGNYLSEGMHMINTALWIITPAQRLEYTLRDLLAFQVIDSLEGSSARGEWKGELSGVIRPKLLWTTDVITEPNSEKTLSSNWVAR